MLLSITSHNFTTSIHSSLNWFVLIKIITKLRLNSILKKKQWRFTTKTYTLLEIFEKSPKTDRYARFWKSVIIILFIVKHVFWYTEHQLYFYWGKIELKCLIFSLTNWMIYLFRQCLFTRRMWMWIFTLYELRSKAIHKTKKINSTVGTHLIWCKTINDLQNFY